MAHHMFGYSGTPLSAPSHNSVVSTSCPGTCGPDILARYPVKERDPQACHTTLHYMTISFVFESNGNLKWSLEELRLQDYLKRQRPCSAPQALESGAAQAVPAVLSASFTRVESTPTPNDNKPSGCFPIIND